MTAGIITIFAALIPFIIWLWKREDAKKDDPRTKNLKAYAQIDSDISKGDSNLASAHASDALDDLDRLQVGSNH